MPGPVSLTEIRTWPSEQWAAFDKHFAFGLIELHGIVQQVHHHLF